MWRIVNGAVEDTFRKMIASSTAGIYTSDIGKLCFESSGRARLITIGTSTGSTDSMGSSGGGLVGIVAYMPANATADSTAMVYVQPLTPWDICEQSYTTASSDSGSSGNDAADYVTTTNLGLVFKLVGQGCSSGSTYASTSGSTWVQDWITASTASVSGSTLGAFKMTNLSTNSKKIYGHFLPEMFAGIAQTTG